MEANIKDIFTDNYYKVCSLAQRFVVSHTLILFRETGIFELLKNNYKTAEEIVRKLNLELQSIIPVEWMLNFLATNGFLERTDLGFKLKSGFVMENSLDIEKEMLRLDDGISILCELTKIVISEYPKFFKGRKGVEIIFSGNKVELWKKYFSNNNSGYRVYNLLGAEGVAYWLNNRLGGVFLELGGGCGSATISLIKKLKSEGKSNLIKEYIFSDVSPTLLRFGYRQLQREISNGEVSLVLKRFNFNEIFIEQRVELESINAVYAVNSLHIARDILFTLKEIYKSLKKGGMLIISECIRSEDNKFPFQEVVFNMLEDYRNVKLIKNVRPNVGFLSVDNWVELLRLAEFNKIEVIDNTTCSRGISRQKLAAVIKGEKLCD